MRKIIILIIVLPYLIISCIDSNDKNAAKAQTGNAFASPQRIISLTPAITEELYLLKADTLLVANTNYCNRPPAARSKKKIGNLIDFDVEMILSVRPDLVLCTTLANNKKIRKLKQSGIKVTEFPAPGSFSEICGNFLKLGIAINRKETAQAIIDKAKKEIERVTNATSKLQKKRVLMQIGAKPLFIVNKNYFINDYIAFGGGVNITGHSDSNIYSRESILVENPDVIIITDMGIAGKEEKQTWMKYNTITAVKNNEIHIVDSEIFCTPTISAFLESLIIITKLLHPEIKS